MPLDLRPALPEPDDSSELRAHVATTMRSANHRDTPALVELLRRSGHDAPEATLAGLGGHCLVLDRTGGGLAAAIHLRIDGPRGRINALAVAPDLQRYRLGARLIGVAEAVCTALGCSQIELAV